MRAGAGRELGQAGRVVGHPAATGWLGSLVPSKAIRHTNEKSSRSGTPEEPENLSGRRWTEDTQ